MLVKTIEHREIALARNAEDSVHALGNESFDKRMPSQTIRRVCSHDEYS